MKVKITGSLTNSDCSLGGTSFWFEHISDCMMLLVQIYLL